MTMISIALVFLGVVGAQLTYRERPELEWDAQVPSLREGNGVFLSPDDGMIIASSSVGQISAFRAADGAEIFQYSYGPNATVDELISSSSGISFSNDNYAIFSILVNENSLNPSTRVVSLSLSGLELWVSPSLEGLSPGTPVVSEDGAHVFLTHNSADGTVGHFTILDGTSGEIFFSQLYESAPFAPLGIYYNPAEGYYDGGENNRNDILVWSVRPKPNETSVGPGATFAFQFPMDFASHGDTSVLTYTALGSDVKDFQAIQKPILSNEGRTLYWGTSRSQLRCWLGEEGMDRYRFSRARTSAVSFTRGTPAMQSVYATPALSNDPLNRSVFGGTASAEFVKVSGDCGDHIVVPTGQLVKSTARVSPDDTYVYYLETDGILHQASTVNLQDEWILDIGGATEGEFSLNQDGTLLYLGDASGLLRAYRVGDVPTPVPVVSGSAAPSSTNTTFAPTAMALDRAPSLGPTRGPAPIRPPASSLTSQPTKTSGDNGSGTGNQESGVDISRQSVSCFFIAAALVWVVAL